MGSLRDNGLVRSILSQETQELLADGADAAVDSLTESGALEQIPVVGAVLKLARASQGIREHLFINKLAYFLEEASKLSEEERNRFAKKFKDPEEVDRFGASLLILVEKAEDFDKPRIFGRLLVACAKGHFDVTDLMRLCKMVNRAITEDFLYLKNMHRGSHQAKNKDVEQGLYTAGFLSFGGIDGGLMEDPDSGGVGYEFTVYGRWLVELGLAKGPTPEPEPSNPLF